MGNLSEQNQKSTANKLYIKVDWKNQYGGYKSKIFEFNDQRHFDNWHYKFVNNAYGNKIIGHEEVSEEEFKKQK
jgi:hypothetical protein